MGELNTKEWNLVVTEDVDFYKPCSDLPKPFKGRQWG